MCKLQYAGINIFSLKNIPLILCKSTYYYDHYIEIHLTGNFKKSMLFCKMQHLFRQRKEKEQRYKNSFCSTINSFISCLFSHSHFPPSLYFSDPKWRIIILEGDGMSWAPQMLRQPVYYQISKATIPNGCLRIFVFIWVTENSRYKMIAFQVLFRTTM